MKYLESIRNALDYLLGNDDKVYIIGEDILQNLMTISEIPKKINDKNVPETLEIRGEVYIGKKNFESSQISEFWPFSAISGQI